MSSGGVTVTTEPPRRWICVAVGVVVPEAGGEFSDSGLFSMIVVRRCGERSSPGKYSVASSELFAFASVSPTTERGLRLTLPPLSDLLRAARSELREGW